MCPTPKSRPVRTDLKKKVLGGQLLDEFCLVTGLRFRVENLADYNDGELPIPFRRRVFPSSLDGEHIIGNIVFRIIDDELFDRIHDDDAVSLCCLSILQLVLLGVEGKRKIPYWMLRLANDRGTMPAARLTLDETEARLDWWISSRAYFDGGIGQAERVPRHLNRQNMYEVPSEFYRQFEEQKRDIEKQKRDIEEIRKKEADHQETYEKVRKFMEDMNVELVRQANKRPIIVSQHYGISDLSEFPSMQMPAHSTTPFWQPTIPLHPGTYNWQSPIPSHMGNPNLQPPIGRHHDAAGLFDQNILNPGKREHRPSIYKWSPYMEQPHSTDLPKKRGNKTKNNVKKSNLSPLNLGNALHDDNEGGDDVMFLGVQFTGNYLVYKNVNISKEDRGRQLAMMNLAHEFNDTSTTKDELRKAYEECRDIPLEQRALIEKFLKIKADLDYEMNNDLLLKETMLEKQIRDKIHISYQQAWRGKDYDSYVSQLSTPCAYDRCCAFKWSMKGNKSGGCSHGWNQSDYANCICVESVNAHSVIYRKEPVLKLAETYRAMVQQCNPEQVRLTVLTKLQEALDEEAILEEQILVLMHRFADRRHDRGGHEKVVHLKSVRDEEHGRKATTDDKLYRHVKALLLNTSFHSYRLNK
nr:phospholipase-like protein [Tanacetum cinerariifolium]